MLRESATPTSHLDLIPSRNCFNLVELGCCSSHQLVWVNFSDIILLETWRHWRLYELFQVVSLAPAEEARTNMSNNAIRGKNSYSLLVVSMVHHKYQFDYVLHRSSLCLDSDLPFRLPIKKLQLPSSIVGCLSLQCGQSLQSVTFAFFQA